MSLAHPAATSPLERVLAASADCGWREAASNPGQFYGHCPAHDDHKRSASLKADDSTGKAVLFCQAGCSYSDMLKAMGLPANTLSVRGAKVVRQQAESDAWSKQALRRAVELMRNQDRLDDLAHSERWTIEALDALNVGSYGEHQLAIPERNHVAQVVGNLLHVPRHLRTDSNAPHKIAERDGDRGLTYRGGGPQGSLVVVVEGPACALSALSLGFEPVGVPSANIDRDQWLRHVVKGKEVVLLPDADSTGRKAADRMSETLLPYVESLQLVNLFPFRHDGSDIGDVLREKGHAEGAAFVRKRIDRARPLARPKRGRPPTQLELAKTYLLHALRDRQWHSTTEVMHGAPDSVSERTVKAARKALGVEARRGDTCWKLRLPVGEH